MTGARSRRKGHAWEREIAARFREIGYPAARVLTECRDGNSGDIEIKGAPLTVQVKCGAAPSVWRAVREAEQAAALRHFHPVAVVKRDRTGPIAALPLADFMEMVRLLRACGAW